MSKRFVRLAKATNGELVGINPQSVQAVLIEGPEVTRLMIGGNAIHVRGTVSEVLRKLEQADDRA